jgi:hypothetical protein
MPANFSDGTLDLPEDPAQDHADEALQNGDHALSYGSDRDAVSTL